MSSSSMNRDPRRPRGNRGPKPDNVRRDGDSEQDINYGTVRAAGGYAGPPRRARTDDTNSGLGISAVFTENSAVVAIFALLHGLVLFWLPVLSPASILAAVCLVVSCSIRGHKPDDMRYAGLRGVLQLIAGAAILVRLGGGIFNGWEQNGWFIIHRLPDSVRAWGDLDSVFRALLVDPVGFLLLGVLLSDLWLPQIARAGISGETFWNRYLTPRLMESRPSNPTGLMTILPYFFITTMPTTADKIYALALGLGTSFIVGYIVMVEAADILAVNRLNLAGRARHYDRFSDRRYAPVIAIEYGLPRVVVLFFLGAIAILLTPRGPYGGLVPLGVVAIGSIVFSIATFLLSWQAIALFEQYPASELPKPGMHDISTVVENPTARKRLLRLALLAWAPFVINCLNDFLPPLPKFDGWGIVWPDLKLKRLAFAAIVLVFLPVQLVAGVLRAGFGSTLSQFAKAGAR